MLKELNILKGKDYRNTKSIDFQNIICNLLKKKRKISRQVWVEDRGDGKRGKIDIIFSYDIGKYVAIQIDNKSPRAKSIYKLKQYQADKSYILLRSPFKVIKL